MIILRVMRRNIGGESVCFYVKRVTNENREAIIRLKVKDSQSGFIESNAYSLAQSKFEPYWNPVALYKEDCIVGFAMYGKITVDREEQVWLDRFMIDYRFQGFGYSKIFMRKLIDVLFRTYQCDKIYLSVFEDNENAIHIYKNIGFQFTDLRDRLGEIIAYLNINA